MTNIDLTTKSTIYNSIGAQAQWIQHRFGRRNYPILSLDTASAITAISQINDVIHFMSIFGDPCCHPDFIEILKSVETGKSVVNTYLNFKNDAIISALSESRSYVVVPIYGIGHLADKILLNSDWDIILQNLTNLQCKVCIEFYCFDHNIAQVEAVKDLCNKYNFDLNIRTGTAIHPDGFSPIVNEHGEWLYDVYSCSDPTNVNWPNLYKTVNGYNSLIQFLRPTKGRSILNNPIFYNVKEKFSYDNNISISVTGHVFPSFNLHQLFSNALCDDWNLSFENIVGLNKLTIRPDFKYLCSAISTIVDILNTDNNIYSKDFKDILTNFADSNI